MKTHHFHSKLLCQKPMLGQTEWRLQNWLITKSGVLAVTALFFWKICFSLRTSWKELIWCTNDPNVHIRIFRKHWSLILGCFFPVSTLKKQKQLYICHFPPSSSFPRLFRNIRELGAKMHFTDHRRINRIQLFIAIKGNFSSSFFLWTNRSQGKFPRDYLINAANCLQYLHIVKIDIKKWRITCLKWHDNNRVNSHCRNIFCNNVFYGLINKKLVGMVSTNNV